MNLIWRAVYRFYRVMSWIIYWSQRRFTLAGWMVLTGLVCMSSFGSLDTETLSAYQAFPLLLLLIVSAVAFSWFFRVKFSAVRFLPRFGTTGQTFSYRIRIKNL